MKRLAAAPAILCAWLLAAADAPPQPIPFSHKTHAGAMRLACKMCHPNPDPGETMTIAAPARCMECHSAIKTGSPAIQRLAAYAKEGRAVPWARVYVLPGFVNFSHRRHLEKGATCQDCHGPVAERDRLFAEPEISMGGCISCHQVRKVSADCGFCHENPQ